MTADKDALLREQLKSIEFSQNGYCPACGGWEVTRGRGCEPKVHTKTCWLNARITRAAEKDDGGWLPIETAPEDGRWLYEGEPTFCHSFYIKAVGWRPLPPLPKGDE